jgi:hypothetical protein
MGTSCVTHSRKRPLVEPGHKWEDNIKMHVKEIDWDGMDRINVAQDRDK